MDGTPHLLTDVKFSERRRGYDPDEVDNFLERVSAAVAQLQDKLRQATARAEGADKRIADAERAQAVAEAQVDKLKADLEAARAAAAETPPASEAAAADTGADAAAKVLALAQRTADAAVADARVKAASVVAEAERTAEQTLVEARRRADELVAERQRTVLEEVRTLEDLRRQLEADVEALRAHLEQQWAVVRGGVEALQRLLDDPEALRLLPPPTLSGASSAGLAVSGAEPVTAAPAPGVGADSPTTEQAAITVEPPENPPEEAPTEAAATAEEPVGSDHDDAGPALRADDAPVAEPGPEAAPEPEDEQAAEVDEELTVAIVGAEAGERTADAPVGDTADVEPATSALFPPSDESAQPPAEPEPTELFSPLGTATGDDESPLGAPDREADEAMRAFFEADFEEPKSGRSRFGRRR